MNLDQQRRYARQAMLPEIGAAGQETLLRTRVLIVGAGGLGSALISYLAAAGIGTLGICDDDRVELSNLARQIVHETGDVGRLKIESASDRVAELNPDVKVITHGESLNEDNADALIAGYDIVADGSDNFATRFALNDACVKAKKPLVSAAVAGWSGQLMTVAPGGPCYRCLVHAEAPDADTCTATGVIGPLVGMVGSAQALEVLRVALGNPALADRLALFDGHTGAVRLVERSRDGDCPVCGSIL